MRDMVNVRKSFSVGFLQELIGMRPGHSVAGTVRSYVPDARAAQMLDHYTQYVGSCPEADLLANFHTAHQTARERGFTRFLTDLSGMGQGPRPGSLIDSIHLREKLSIPRNIKEGVVCPPGLMAEVDVKFYENACRNRGWNVRVFPERAAALAWLRAP